MPSSPKRSVKRRSKPHRESRSRAAAPKPAGRWTPPSGDTWLILALAAFAVLVRLPHLGWELPVVEEEALPMKKAFAMWGWDTGHIDWNPHTAGWPSLSFYLHLLVQHLHYTFGRLTGAFHDRGDYFVSFWLDPGPLLLLSRGVSVVANAITVAVAARLALRLAGRSAALLVGGMLALSPLLVEHSQLVIPDVLSALFAMLAVDRIVSIAVRDQRSDDLWAGLWIGLGASSKYTPLLLIPGLLIAYGLRLPNVWRSARPLRALAVTAAAFLVTSPFLLFDSEARARDVAQQVLHLTSGHLGAEAGGPGLIRYVTHVLGPGLGWGGLMAAWVGFVWGARRERSEWRAVLFCVVPYYLVLALLRTQFPRYALPLAAPLAVGAGALVAWIQSAPWSTRRKAVLITLATIVAWTPAAVGSWKYHQLQGRVSTQSLADQFVKDVNRNEPVLVAAEVLALSLPTERAAQAALGRATTLSPQQQQRMMSRPTYTIDFLPMYTVQPEEAERYYDIRHFTSHDYVVVTDAVRTRYLADTVRFAPEAVFYRDLDRYASEVARFSAGPRVRGAEIRVYRMPRDASDRIERDRGVLEMPMLEPEARVHITDYMEFTEGMARAAYTRGGWARAARYYGAMLTAGEAGWMTEVERLPLIRMMALLEQRSGATAEAIRYYESYLARVPGDSTARATLTQLRASPGRTGTSPRP